MSAKKRELISLFSIPVVKINIGRNFTKEEIECIANIPMKKNEEEGQEMEKHQSKCFKIFDNFAEELKDIKSFCEQELKQYLEKIEGVDTDLTGLRITQSWLNKIEPQGYHSMHNHRNSYLSGILYISCLSNDYLQFTDRNQMCYKTLELPKKEITKFNAIGALINVKEGDLIIFPSWVPHQVGVNETKNKDRISLSFDTFPTYLPSLYPPYK